MGKYEELYNQFKLIDRINQLNDEASGLRDRLASIEENRVNLQNNR